MQNLDDSVPNESPAVNVVDFIVCGTQKGGTSALDAYLREHPDLCMANEKEVHFFDRDSYFSNGRPDYSQYHACFTLERADQLVGEATPIYMYWYDAPRRMWDYNPNLKLILILRNPIERAYSHWNMERIRNAETLPFWDAILLERERCRSSLPLQHRVYSYLDRGFYLQQLRRLQTYFLDSQILVVKNEDLKSNPTAILNRICDFLGVSRLESITHKDVHSRPYIDTMSDREWEYLKHLYEYEIRGLERLLGWDCSDWLAKRG
ncbi:MAG: sulfotransferase domain-containing protein [Cyanobacteria bacterium J06597_1]